MTNEPSPSSPSTPPYDGPSVRERIRLLRKAVDERRKLKMPKADPLEPDPDSGPCAHWFETAELYLKKAIEAEDEADFLKYADWADAYETAGLGCEALKHTLP